jgi:hypothetical protein
VLTPQPQQQQQQRKGGGRQSEMGSSSLAADFTLKIPTPINTSNLVNQDDNRSRMLFGSAGDNNRKSSWGNDGVSTPSSATLPPGLPLDRMPSGSVGPIGTPTNSNSHSEYSQFNNSHWLSQPKAEQTVQPASDRFSLGGNDFGLSVQPPPSSSSASDNWMGGGGGGGRSMHNMPPAQQGRGESFPRGIMNQDMRPSNDYRGAPGGGGGGGGMGGDMRGNYPMQPQQQSGSGNMMGMDGRGMDRMQGAGNFGGNTNQSSNNWNNPNVPVNTRSSNSLPTSQGSSFLNQNQWEQQNRFSTGVEDTNSTYFSSSGRQSPPSFLSQQHQQQQSMAQSHNQRDQQQQQQHQFMQNQSTYSNIPSTGLFGDSNFNNNAFQQQQQHQQPQTQQQQPKYNSSNNNLSNNSPFHQQGGGGGYSKY